MYVNIKKDEAIKYAGSKRKLATLLGIRRQSITTWNEYLPQTSALKLYIITNGKLGCKITNKDGGGD